MVHVAATGTGAVFAPLGDRPRDRYLHHAPQQERVCASTIELSSLLVETYDEQKETHEVPGEDGTAAHHTVLRLIKVGMSISQ